MASYSVDPGDPDASYLSFWREKHLCTLTTLRPDGTPHVVPVAVTYDPGARLARVVANGSSTKVRHVRAVVSAERERVAEAERRYAERYGRTPRPNPARVVIEIALTRALGRG